MAIIPTPTTLWRVSSPDTAPVTLRATDWISALGGALHQLGRSQHINRMACERLLNGDLIINDLTHDSRYVVQHLSTAADLLMPGAAPKRSTTERPRAASMARSVRGARAAGDAAEALVMSDAAEPDALLSERSSTVEILMRHRRVRLPTETPAPEGRAATTGAVRAHRVIEEEPLLEEHDIDTEDLPLAMGSAEAESDAGMPGGVTSGEHMRPVSAVVSGAAAEDPALSMELEDVFSLAADDRSMPSEELTLTEASPRRRLSAVLKEIRARRISKRSTP